MEFICGNLIKCGCLAIIYQHPIIKSMFQIVYAIFYVSFKTVKHFGNDDDTHKEEWVRVEIRRKI